jgi:hypothetical protein
MTETTTRQPGAPSARLGWKTLLAVLAFYFVCLSIATYPLILNVRTCLPGSLLDPLQHLWIMKWYRACLLEGKSPVISPEIQFPIGAPLGCFSPLHFQALLFIPLSLLIRDDVICFNIVWCVGMLTTGLGSFLLIWLVLRHRASAAIGGLTVMISGPMLLHARAHLELIHLGSFPLFLVGWIRFIDRPSRRRLFVAAALYVLVGLCAAYYVAFAMVPAALYVVCQLLRSGRSGAWPWLLTRTRWLGAFCAVAVTALAAVFGNQLWAMANGYPIPRPISEFNGYGSPIWSYLVPTVLHRLHAILPFDPYGAAGFGWSVGERASYLGVVTLVLIYYAAVNRVRFSRGTYFWILTALLVVLACGASWEIGSWRITLPALWLKKTVVAFKMVRVPARFNLFVAVSASVLAAAGLKHLLERIPRRLWRVAACSALALVILADLSTNPFPSPSIPPIPRAYAHIRARDPEATFVDVPQSSSGGSELCSLFGYWQTLHRAPTTAGYSGHGNVPFDDQLSWNSPFSSARLTDPDYLRLATNTTFDIVTDADFNSYAWLYLTANHLRYVVLHHWKSGMPDGPYYFEGIRACLNGARVYEDEATSVYARDRMRPPTRPTLLTTLGWRLAWDGHLMRVMSREGKFSIFNTDEVRDLRFVFEAKALHGSRIVRLVSQGRDLATWSVSPERYQLYVSGPIRLPPGLQEAKLVCDGEETPNKNELALEWDEKPYSLRVRGVNLAPWPAETISTPGVAAQGAPTRR